MKNKLKINNSNKIRQFSQATKITKAFWVPLSSTNKINKMNYNYNARKHNQ